MIIGLEGQYFRRLAFCVADEQVGSGGNQHVADAASFHRSRFVQRRLTFVIVNHVDDGVGSVSNQEPHDVFVAVAAGVVEGGEPHRVD